MARLTKQDIQAQTLTFAEDEVAMPELGGSLLVRQMSAGKRTELIDGLVDEEGNVTDLKLMQARMFAASVVDPQFTPDEARAMMEQWPASMWDRVMQAVNKLTPNPREVERAAAQEFRGSGE
jgi:hypothetical protein